VFSFLKDTINQVSRCW